MQQQSARASVERLVAATNAHDLDAIIGCFAVGYRNDTPAHPERSFTGRDQVRRNWEQILAVMPDVTVEVLRCTADGDIVWSEWEHRGTRPDGSLHLLRGVIIFGVCEGDIAWARFYLEPVQEGAGTIDQAVRRQASGDER
jgi:ketosteroid isomerase-like protein